MTIVSPSSSAQLRPESRRHVCPHRRRPRNHQADLLADPQCLYRFHQDDDEPRRRGHRCGARRKEGGRLWLQFQWPLWAGRVDPRTVCAAPCRSRSEHPAQRRRRQSGSRSGLGGADVEREAGRPWRALGCGRHHRHGGVGCGGEDRGQAVVSAVGRASPTNRQSARLRLRRRRLLLSRQGSRRCAPKCAATSIAATMS